MGFFGRRKNKPAPATRGSALAPVPSLHVTERKAECRSSDHDDIRSERRRPERRSSNEKSENSDNPCDSKEPDHHYLQGFDADLEYNMS